MSATVLPKKRENLAHVETDLTVCEIGVDTETRSETEREIGKETHCESSDESDTRGSDDVISSQFLLAKVVVDVCDTDWVVWGTCTHTWSSSVGEDGSVDTDDLSNQPIHTVCFLVEVLT